MRKIRAERSGRGDGRIYTLQVSCSDNAGNTATGTATVTVPHDQGGDDDPSKCRFRVGLENSENNRVKAALDITAATLPENLSGHELEVTIGGENVSGTFGENGEIVTDTFLARVNSNGFLVIDVRGIDLVSILGLDPEADLRGVVVELAVHATLTAPDNGEGEPAEAITLFDGTLRCEYRQKGGKRGKGKEAPRSPAASVSDTTTGSR